MELYAAPDDDIEIALTRFYRVAGAKIVGPQNALESSWRVVDAFGPQRSIEVSSLKVSCDPRVLAADASDRRYGLLTRSSWSIEEPWSGARISDNSFLRLNGRSVSAGIDRGLLTPLQLAVTYSGLPVAVMDHDLSATVTVGPNPAADVLKVSSETGLGHVVITSTDGRVVYDETFSLDQREQGIDVSSLAQGTYALQVGRHRRLLIIHR